jgi:orotate phosphoribosyltransferase
MTENEAIEIFKKSGAYLEGHFLLSSGLHSPGYVEKFQVLQHPAYCDLLCEEIARRFADDKPDLVLGPATGGIILAYATARALKIRGIFMEREDGKMALRRGFEIGPKERVLLVEDIVTTGKSVFEVLDSLGSLINEGRLVGMACLVDRSGGAVKFGLPRQEALIRLDLPTYTVESCPLCAKGIPLTKRGSRKMP